MVVRHFYGKRMDHIKGQNSRNQVVYTCLNRNTDVREKKVGHRALDGDEVCKVCKVVNSRI